MTPEPIPEAHTPIVLDCGLVYSVAVNHFLLVDDSDNDFFLLQHAMKKSGMAATLHRVAGVEQAMEYFQLAMNDGVEMPCAVLCDVRLRHETSCDLLEWIRQQPELKKMIILVWSGSTHHRETARLLDSGIHAVIDKPTQTADFVSILQTLQRLCDELKD